MGGEMQTWGDYKALVKRARSREGPSRVNHSLTHHQALDILEAAIKDRPDDETVGAGARDGLMVRNIERECGLRLTD